MKNVEKDKQLEEDFKVTCSQGILTKHNKDGTIETIIEPNSQRVTEALVREFLNDERNTNLTEKDVIEGFREFKHIFESLTPNIFQE